MSEVKVNLSIVLPGRTLLSKEECLKTTQKVIEKKLKNGKVFKKTISIQVEDWSKMNKHSMKVEAKGEKPEIITFHTRQSRPALQVLNISKEAYDCMIDKNCCPPWVKPSKWTTMHTREMLESHLQRIVEHLGGISYTYKVFED